MYVCCFQCNLVSLQCICLFTSHFAAAELDPEVLTIPEVYPLA